MAYCPECGFQVAEIDIFCPNCGISLQPLNVSLEVAEDKDSFEKTIAAGQADLEQILEETSPKDSTNSLNPATSAQTVAPENLPATDVEESELEIAEEKISSKTVENLSKTSESVDFFSNDLQKPAEIPAENELGENEEDDDFNLPMKFSDDELENALQDLPEAVNLEDDSVIETDVDNLIEEVVEIEKPDEPVFKSSTGKIAAPKAEESENNENPETTTESSLMSYEETEVREKLTIDEVEAEVEPAVDEPEENSLELDKTLSYIPDLESFKNDEPKTEVPSTRQNIEVKPVENKIEKPDPALIADNKPTAKSEFDSVKIFNNEDSPEEIQKINPDEQVEFKQTESAKIELEDLNEVSKNAESSEQGKISLTKPNLSDSDTDNKSAGKLKPLDEGTVLNGRYEIVRKIGGGGMGAVYLASDKNLGGVMRAVKEMVQSYIEEEQQDKAVSDFKRESMLLTSLEHQGIPTIYDYFYDEKEARFYLVMKYISGGDLSARLRSAPEGRIDEKLVTEWAIQIAEVLEYLHNRQPPIVYRDLKPANIMIDGNSGRAMLIDFGIARWINKEEKGVTAVGTMGYAPPELFSGNVESRSDIYSLGSTMFHLLTGADPQSNPLLIFDFQKNPKPRQINPKLSDQMEKILMRTVEYNADKRFFSAAELKNELKKHLENLNSRDVSFGVSKSPHAVAFSDEPVFCGFCGQKIVATDLFCAFCGAKQPIAQKGVHAENYVSSGLTAKLLILGTNELDSPSYKLDKDDNLLGRRDPISNIFPEVDLSKFDPQTKISRKHARIWRDGKNYLLEDLGSSNGTLILPVISDTVRLLPNQPHVLSNGDKIKIGDTTLHFVLG